MNRATTAYSPGFGKANPSREASLAKNPCGICTRMPAPSPARGSAPTAPRCSRLQRMASASSISLCDLRPLMSAMKPTPQESLSSAGSYRPCADGADLSAPPAKRAAPRAVRPALRPICFARLRVAPIVVLASHPANAREASLGGALFRPGHRPAPRSRRHPWSLAAFSLPPLGASAWPHVLGDLAMRWPRLSPLRYGPDDRPAPGRAANWDSNAVLTYLAKF